jgi:hypothetical protein
VTTSEYPLLNVFEVFFCCLAYAGDPTLLFVQAGREDTRCEESVDVLESIGTTALMVAGSVLVLLVCEGSRVENTFRRDKHPNDSIEGSLQDSHS